MPVKNIYKHYFCLPFFFFLIFVICSSSAKEFNRNLNYYIGHDTLLFDGDSPLQFDLKTDNCPVKVTYSKGTTKGKRIVQKPFQVCVDQPGFINVEEDGPLSPDDVLAPGSNIITGDNSSV